MSGQISHMSVVEKGAACFTSLQSPHTTHASSNFYMPALLWDRKCASDLVDEQMNDTYEADFQRSTRRRDWWHISVFVRGDSSSIGGRTLLPPDGSRVDVHIDDGQLSQLEWTRKTYHGPDCMLEIVARLSNRSDTHGAFHGGTHRVKTQYSERSRQDSSKTPLHCTTPHSAVRAITDCRT